MLSVNLHQLELEGGRLVLICNKFTIVLECPK